MVNEQVSRTVLEYAVNDASVKKVITTTDKVERAITDSLGILGDYGPVTKAAMRSVEVGFNTLEQNARESRNELEALRSELLSLDDIQVTPRVDVQSTNPKSLETARQGVGDLSTLFGAGASALGGSGALSGVGDVLGLAEYIPLAGQALASLTPAMIGISGAALVLAPAISAVTSEIDKNVKREKARAEALQQVAEAILTGTRAQIEAQVQALEAENAVRELQIDLIEKQTGRSREYLQDLTRTDFNDFSLIGGVADLIDTINGLGGQAGVVVEASASIEQNTFLIDALRGVLENNATATNDMIEYENTLTQERIAGANAGIQREIEHQQLLREGTAEAVRNRIEGLQDEFDATIAANQALIASGDTSEEAAQQIYEFAMKTTELNDQMTDLRNNILPVLEATEQLAAAEKTRNELTDKLFEAQQREGEARDKARQSLDDYIKAEFEHEASLAQIQKDADDKRKEVETERSEQRIKLEEQTSKRVLDIVRKTNAMLSTAIANRDILAYVLAKQSQEEQLKSEDESYKERQKDLDAALKKQLDSQEKALRQAVDRENQRWNEERATRQRAQQQIALDVQNAEAQVRAIQQNANAQTIALMAQRALYEQGKYQQMASTGAFYLDYLVNKSNAAFQAIASVVSTPTSGIGSSSRTGFQPTPFDTGGDVTRTGLALVHAGERIYTPLQPAGKSPLPSSITNNQNMGGPVFNIQGMTPQQIITQVTDTLHDYFSRAGLIQG